MLDRNVLNSDKYCCMSNDSQLAYIKLLLEADDDGIINNAIRTIKSMSTDYDFNSILEELINNGFLLKAEEGVYIVTHWLLHNYIKKDRYKPSVELARDKIWILENRQYTLEEKGTKLTEFYDDEVKSKKRVTSEKKRKVSDEVKDEIWSAYPKKSGKTAAFKSLDSILSKYTKEEILRCVERYCKERKKEIESGDMQYILMGSSFFSNKGRWKDYLDENYDDSSSKCDNLNKGNKAYIKYYE